MTFTVTSALLRYSEGLYNLNRNLIALYGVDIIDNAGQYERMVEEIIQVIPRLVPYAHNKTSGEYVICSTDGLMEFSDNIPFLKAEYECILQKHYAFLHKVKKIRNKFEHRMHGAKLVASGSGGSSLFEATFHVDGEDVELSDNEIVAFAKALNTLFSKIQRLVDQFAYERNLDDRPYYCRLLRCNFQEFNSIYESDLLGVFGKTLFPF